MIQKTIDIISKFVLRIKAMARELASARPASSEMEGMPSPIKSRQILKQAQAMRVIFFYPGEEGTYIENPFVTLLENGVVHIQSPFEETTTHLRNCEILWQFQTQTEERGSKIRLLRPQSPHAGPPKQPEPEPEL